MITTIYRDNRVPKIEIRNYGRVSFHLFRRDTLREIDVVTSYESDNYEVSAEYAQDTAAQIFDSLINLELVIAQD